MKRSISLVVARPDIVAHLAVELVGAFGATRLLDASYESRVGSIRFFAIVLLVSASPSCPRAAGRRAIVSDPIIASR